MNVILALTVNVHFLVVFLSQPSSQFWLCTSLPLSAWRKGISFKFRTVVMDGKSDSFSRIGSFKRFVPMNDFEKLIQRFFAHCTSLWLNIWCICSTLIWRHFRSVVRLVRLYRISGVVPIFNPLPNYYPLVEIWLPNPNRTPNPYLSPTLTLNLPVLGRK